MKRILGVGNATLDIITTVDGYPTEDSESRASSQRLSVGGNVANTLRVLALLGYECDFVGVLCDDPLGLTIRDGLQKAGIGYEASPVTSGKAPVSQITINARCGSRTIVHFRDLPELSATQLKEHVDLTRFDWFHVEARRLTDEIEAMLLWIRHTAKAIPISLEIEKPHPGVDRLMPHADILFFSREYATALGYASAPAFLRDTQCAAAGRLCTCAWGAEGAYALDPEGLLLHSPAYAPARVVDTLGAGDTFNAAFIDAWTRGFNARAALEHACQLAGKKCGQIGFENLVAFQDPSSRR